MSDQSPESLRNEIMTLLEKFHSAQWGTEPEFVPGVTPIQVSGRVFDRSELLSLVDAALDMWLTTGRFTTDFERRFAGVMGVRHALLCNSGSSANLLALSALTSPKLHSQRLQPGDEVITCATGFPTTVNPILQQGLVPVFVDADPVTYNAMSDRLEAAVGPRTRAIMMAHTLGNPFDLDTVMRVAQDRGLWVIEDNCDATGSTYRGQLTGTFGDLSTVSFYPAHHITMGEGGCVLTRRHLLHRLAESFRDWGRDCWCPPGGEDTCHRRFKWQLGDLPEGYDHKYTYSHLGYNLKATDMQAAVGVAQLDKLAGFTAARRRNWNILKSGLADLGNFFILPEPTPQSDPSWFGFCLTVRSDAPFTRRQLITHLERQKIATRQLFAGNLVRQPAFRTANYRIVGDLTNSDTIMRDSFWIGVYPGLTQKMLDYMLASVHEFVRGASKATFTEASA